MTYEFRRVRTLFIAAACVLALNGCRRQPAANSNLSPPPVVATPPPTTYPMPPVRSARANLGWTTTGSEKHMRLGDYQDKVVVLDFYATWCGPCRDSIPHLVELQQRYGQEGLQVVGLNVGGPGDLDEVPAFAKEFHIQYQLGNPDPDLERFYMGEEGSIPLTVVFDRKGRQVRRFVGYGESMDQDLEQIIQKSLQQK